MRLVHMSKLMSYEHPAVNFVSELVSSFIQIRGFLSRFHHVLPACRKFDMCTACSETVRYTML